MKSYVKIISNVLVLATSVFMLNACSGQMNKQSGGTLIGGLAGGLLGSQLLEKSSRQALEYSPSGSSVEWRNPDSGNYGYITPTNTLKTEQGYCREYTQEVVIGGERKKAYGKACRKPDGNWEIVK